MAQVTRRLAFYDLRDWWLSDPDVRRLIVDSRTNKDDPFFPVAQQPEGGFPYIRYTVARSLGSPQWWMHTEQVGIDLYTGNILDSTELLNKLISMAGREDESAQDLEQFLHERNEALVADGDDPRPIDFVYHNIKYIGGGDIGASNEEGGAHSRIMMFNIEYSPVSGLGIKS